MIEALVAAAILLGGAAATVAAFDSTTQTSHTSEREAEAVSLAEKELERIAGEPFAQINDCVAPDAGTGRSDDPQSWVQGSQFFVARNLRPSGGYATPPPADLSGDNQLALEPLVVSDAPGCVQPVGDASAVGVQSDSKVAHSKLFRFVSYASQSCSSTIGTTVTGSLASSSLAATLQSTLTASASADASSICNAMATKEAKRVTVAVVLNRVDNGAGLRYPVYVSTLVFDPGAALHVSTGNVIG